MARLSEQDLRIVERETLHLNGRAWGLAFGLGCGLTLFVATIVLVLEGGPTVGAHLGLLAAFLPGYRVTVAGAFIGFMYMLVIGYAMGRFIGLVYNRVAHPRG